MAPSFFSGPGSSSHAKYFDIRLDEPYIVFRGNEEESASAHLKGTLVLCLSEPLTIKHLRLHLTGMSRISWPFLIGAVPGTKKHGKERTFFEKTWKFRDAGKGKTEIMPADNYEFPFDIVLPGSLPESIEGLPDTWIIYRFKAEIGRKYAKDIQVRKPLRIIRTLAPSALELSHVMSVENIWPNKLEYSISTPSKAVVFGTSVRIDFRLAPLLKGLKIGMITTQFIESYDVMSCRDDSQLQPTSHKSIRVVVADHFRLGPEEERRFLEEGEEGYQFSRVLDLPKKLSKCIQDTDTKGIKIRHKLKFKIQLHNPDGHTSELRATLPAFIFLSPNLPLDDNNNLVNQSPTSPQVAEFCMAQQAPPLYGEHQFDMLYSELDPHGYRTPGIYSGVATPLYGSISRNLSTENLSSLAALDTGGDVAASILHNRLVNLHIDSSSLRSPGTPPPEFLSPDAHDNRRSMTFPVTTFTAATTPDISRRTSEDEHPPSGLVSPHFLRTNDVEDLSRVPSYSTAVRSCAMSANNYGPPNYETATAGDISPVSERPPSPPRHNTARALNRLSSTFVDALPQFSIHRHSTGHDHDSERRVRILQARST
ncbi:hypothetical protein H109_03553 [Trichophyton interdigitale MR816]|uniref:Carbon catabolite repressor D n=1 Tax=Trichophyton interdigitale (strain MR816) TaxID=1215338 RepID=A0A059J9V5_TRIIM|nr:hypothetical protein H109_03553 [Trichophyton interdigitale MR816]